MAGLFGRFTGATPPAAPPAPAATPVAGAPATPPAAPVPPAPPDKFEQFTKTMGAAIAPKLGADGKPIAPTAAKSVYSDFTDEVIGSKLSTVAISNQFPAEDWAVVSGNNPEVATKLQGMFDTMFRKTLAAAFRGAINVSEHGLTESFNQFETGKLPEYLDKLKVQNAVGGAHPLLRDPAMQPIIEPMIAGLRVQYPDATEQELQDHALSQLEGLGEKLTGLKKKPTAFGPNGSNVDLTGGNGPVERVFDF